MSGLELVPIGTILSLLVDQVILTAIAVNDVLIAKECFNTLSKHLSNLETIFVVLQKHELKDTPALRRTLEFLKEDCEKANSLVKKYKSCGKIYTLLFCRRIANEIQDVTRTIGRSLAMLPLANTEVISEVSDKVNRLQSEMQETELVISQSSLTILEKLKHGIREQKHDQNFRNSMLEQIASLAGISKEPSEIINELDSLKIEKEEAAARKEKQDETLLKQVIELLSNTDAVRDAEIRKKYDLIRSTIDKSVIRNGRIPVYNAYLCPINKSVMADPVDLCNGTTCERAAIEARFLEGHTEDPRTGKPLEDLTLKPNISVRQSIQQWKEQNYYLKIREAKEVLQSGDSSAYDGALCEIQEVIKENMDTKFWIAMEGLVEIIVLLLGTTSGNLKSRFFQTLLDIVERHSHNKDKSVVAGVFPHIVKCLGLDSSVCKAAVNLLFELLHENDRLCQAIPQEDWRWNEDFCKKLKQQHGTTAFLVVIILDKQFSELAKKAEDILFQLCFNDDATILDVASYRWYKPLVQHLSDGPESSKKYLMRGLERMQLIDEDVKQLGKDGVIDPLVKLAMTDAESKELAFSVMAKLSSSLENIKFFLEARAVSLILDQIFSPQVSPIIRENCSGIFEKLTSNGIEFLTGLGIVEQELMLTNLLVFLSNSSTPIGIRKPVFRAFLSICNSVKADAERVIATHNGISSILPLLEDSNNEIRELALQFLYQFSDNEPVVLADLLLDGSGLETFMSFLKDDNRQDSQILAVGLLAKLQNSKNQLIKSLADLNTIPVLVNILVKGTMRARENVLNLLAGFMNPADINMQKRVVESGAYPLLVDILTSGSKTAKAKAAALIGNLSSNSPTLTKAPSTSCFCFPSQKVPTCEVHGGICSVESSFCLLESKAVPPLVMLLRERDDAVKLMAVLTLKTLVQKGCGSKAANVLHRSEAIDPMLYFLSERNPALIEEVLNILVVVFGDKEVAKGYSEKARNSLIQLRSYLTEIKNDHLRTKALDVWNAVETCSSTGSMPV